VLWAAAIAHVFAGDIDYGLAGTLLVGAIPGVWLASRLSLLAPVKPLRLGLAVVLLGAGLGMLQKAGVGIPDAVMIAAPVTTIAVVAGAALREVVRGAPPRAVRGQAA
jgi:hypothetical protein